MIGGSAEGTDMKVAMLFLASALTIGVEGDTDGSVVVSSDEFLIESFRKSRLAFRRRRLRAFDVTMGSPANEADGGKIGSTTKGLGIRVLNVLESRSLSGIGIAPSRGAEGTFAIL
jgi:hypothetical protein